MQFAIRLAPDGPPIAGVSAKVSARISQSLPTRRFRTGAEKAVVAGEGRESISWPRGRREAGEVADDLSRARSMSNEKCERRAAPLFCLTRPDCA